ncbi:MAG: tRNA (N(6)-L-threonylcarbamoyladenosine(37)-C(2))-methylthiotransferase MtaB [Malacoplasma sp.]
MQKKTTNINTFAIHTLGCKVNLFESNLMKNNLTANGLVEVPFNSFADVYIVNTCTVTNKADSKSKFFIRQAYRKNPDSIIVVAGCLSQIDKTLIEKLNISIQIGNKYKGNIYDMIEKFSINKKKVLNVENLLISNKYESEENFVFADKTRAFLKIQDGCNYMCSYCIIPFSRGAQKSKKIDEILNQIMELLSLEYKEIVLTGVNTAGYLDEDGNTFFDLLFAINKLAGNFRIRISSLEPFQITNELIELITSNKNRFCQHWHICMQSGSDQVLLDMNRKYSTDDFLSLINNIKNKSKNSTFTTDYIVGYPTETDETFNESILFLNKINFLDMHIFPFSKRKGTKASYIETVSKRNIKEDLLQVESLRKIMNEQNLMNYIDKDVIVLFEQKDEGAPFYKGYSSEYLKVYVKSNENITNTFQKVKIGKIFLDGLYGTIK